MIYIISVVQSDVTSQIFPPKLFSPSNKQNKKPYMSFFHQIISKKISTLHLICTDYSIAYLLASIYTEKVDQTLYLDKNKDSATQLYWTKYLLH